MYLFKYNCKLCRIQLLYILTHIRLLIRPAYICHTLPPLCEIKLIYKPVCWTYTIFHIKCIYKVATIYIL